MKNVLLVDGDWLAFRNGFAAETKGFDGEPMVDIPTVLKSLDSELHGYAKRFKTGKTPAKIVVALSCKREDGFRRKLFKGYKEARDGQKNRAPVALWAIKEQLRTEWGALQWPKLEADDILGILSTEPVKGERRIIVGADKDFYGVPGYFFRQVKGVEGPELVTPEAATRWHAMQTLMGDPSDGYTGVPGIGPKKAEAILEDLKPSRFWPAIVKAYKEAGLKEKDALLNARCARILQHGDYNQETRVIKLWTPSKT